MNKPDPRREILQAAGQVFSEKGLEHATVREICHSAGVNLASVNYYFGSKEELYIQAVKHARRLREERAPLPKWAPFTPPEQKLCMFVDTMVEQVLGNDGEPWQTRLIMREIMEPTKACEEMVRETFRPYIHVLLGILGELMPPGTPQYKLQQLAFSVIGQCVYYRFHQKVIPMLVSPEDLARHYTPRSISNHISGVILAAIGTRDTLSSAPPESASGSTEPRWETVSPTNPE